MPLDIENLKQWFLLQKRAFPWREVDDPYAIWVSEIMLQQTQAAVVIPYFERWMQQFPTISALALSSNDQVLKAWEGLGYYSRARNLHEGAKYVLEQHSGKLPATEDALKKIKGIGPYTVGAILSFAFRQKKAAVDGNVLRVLTRVFNIHDDISKTKTVNEIRQLAEELLPENEPWIIAEGLIELGATICTKKPKCSTCPLKKNCQSFLKGEVELLPIKSAKQKTEALFRSVAVVMAEGKLLVKKAKENAIMAGLYEFPFIETNGQEKHEGLEKILPLDLTKVCNLSEVTHSFTRFRVKLTPTLFKAEKIKPVIDCEWLSKEELEQFAFSSGHRRIFHEVQKLNLKF